MSKVYFPSSLHGQYAGMVSGRFPSKSSISHTTTAIHNPLVISLPQNTSLVLLQLYNEYTTSQTPMYTKVLYMITSGFQRCYLTGSENVLKDIKYLDDSYTLHKATAVAFDMSTSSQTLKIYACVTTTTTSGNISTTTWVNYAPCASSIGAGGGVSYNAYIFA